MLAATTRPASPDPSRLESKDGEWSSASKNLPPVPLDMAYQGFGDGMEEDAAVVRLFAELGLSFFVSSSSFSKSFSLYGERVGALSHRQRIQQRRNLAVHPEPGQTRDSHQLLQPTHSRWQGCRNGTELA